MVSLRVEPDPQRSLGHARIVLEGLAPPPADARFRIHREGYQKPNLGPQGWQVREEALTPVQALAEGGGTVLILGPALTRHLEPGPFLFALPAAGLETALFWPDTIDVFDGELPPDEPPPPPQPPPKPTTTAPPPPVTPPPIGGDPPPPPPPPPPQPPSRLPLLLLGLLLLAAIGGGGAWYAMREEPAPAPVPTPVPGPVATEERRPPTPPPPPEPPRPSWLETSDGLALRDLVTGAPDAAAIYAAALRRQAAGRHDDALVLFEEAGERGHAPALTALARLYDPNGFVAGRPFRNPDPRAAARYYRDAVQRGDAAAAEPRAALRATLEAQAQAGNGTAETALREFWP